MERKRDTHCPIDAPLPLTFAGKRAGCLGGATWEAPVALTSVLCTGKWAGQIWSLYQPTTKG